MNNVILAATLLCRRVNCLERGQINKGSFNFSVITTFLAALTLLPFLRFDRLHRKPCATYSVSHPTE